MTTTTDTTAPTATPPARTGRPIGAEQPGAATQPTAGRCRASAGCPGSGRHSQPGVDPLAGAAEERDGQRLAFCTSFQASAEVA